MYSKVKELLNLPQSTTTEELARICNEYLWIYKNVLNTSNSDEIKNIASKKFESLVSAMTAEFIPIHSITFVQTKIQETHDVSFVETFLNDYSDSRPLPYQKNSLSKEISALPECPKKYYLQAALIHSTEEKNVATYNKIADLIKKALMLDPTNFVYKQILNDINHEVERYEAELNAWRQAEKERIDHEKKVETTKKVASGIGTALLAVLGAIGMAIGGLFSCICECLDG